MTQKALDLVTQLKHMAGKHNQQTHDPHKGGGSSSGGTDVGHAVENGKVIKGAGKVIWALPGGHSIVRHKAPSGVGTLDGLVTKGGTFIDDGSEVMFGKDRASVHVFWKRQDGQKVWAAELLGPNIRTLASAWALGNTIDAGVAKKVSSVGILRDML